MKLRIYVGKDKALQAEVFDCLMALGCEWRGESNYLKQGSFDAIYTGINTTNGIGVDLFISRDIFEKLRSDFREVTIEDLRDMVVLRRSDVKDATHEDGNNKFYEAHDNKLYHFFDGTWIKCSSEMFKSPTFKRIQKAQDTQPIREYLDIKFHCLRYVADGTKRPDNFILVPEGADTFVQLEDGGGYFWKHGDDGNHHYIGWKTKSKIPDWIRFNETAQWYVNETNQDLGSKIVWQRDPQPEKQSLNDVAKTAEEHRQKGLRAVPRDPSNPHSDYVVDPQLEFELPDTVYQYSASINTPRGTVHYDGVITFPGRITGIEDYHQVRAEIAKDGNTTPDKVNVHTLNIVG